MTTACALSIPLHFASSSSSSSSRGPIIPKDWKQKWHRPDHPLNRKKRESTPDDDEEDWPDDDVHKWVTCMTSWKEREKYDKERSASTLIISVADENGINVDVNSSAQETKTPFGMTIGSVQGGTRIAMGMQNGIIWIFREKKANSQPVTPPTTFTGKAQSPSGSSMTSEMVKSPLHTGLTHSHEIEGLSSPTQAVASTSDVNALASATRHSGTVDAEESLGTQWHAGRENHSVVGGMMEALGLNHTNSHHTHPHGHSHTNSENHSGTSTPSSHQRRISRSIRKDSRSSMISFTTSTGTPPLAIERPRTKSTATTTTDYSEKDTVIDGEVGQKHRLSNLMSPTMQRKCSKASQETRESQEAQISSENSTARVEEVEATVVFQCPTSSPLVSLVKIAGDCLASLQQDGNFILWSLQDATQFQSLNIRTAKITFLEESVAAMPASPALSNATTSLSAFAAFQSGANSPATRSRANSNTTQSNTAILDHLSLQGISRMNSMRLVYDHSESIRDPLLLCYDDAKHCASIVDAINGNVLAVKILADCSGTFFAARFSAEGDCVELIYINSKNNIQVRKVRIATKALPVTVESHKHSSHLSSASAFLRREGLSNANSRAPSIAEEKADHQDLGNGGLQDNLEGVEIINENLLLTWTSNGLHLLRRIGESLFLAESVQIKSPRSVVVDGQLAVVEIETEMLIYQVDQGVSLKQITKFPMNANSDVQVMSMSHGDVIRCCLDDDDKLILSCNERTIWQSTNHDTATQSTITASLPFSMERIAISLCEYCKGRLLPLNQANCKISSQLQVILSCAPCLISSLVIFQSRMKRRQNIKVM